MIEVYIDGASAGNPGPSGAGIFIKRTDGEVERHAIPIGHLSNHEAEYFSLIEALKLCNACHYNNVSFRTDSQLVEQAIDKNFVKNEKYKPLLAEALRYIDTLDLFFIKWIPSKQNRVADELARKAIRLNK